MKVLVLTFVLIVLVAASEGKLTSRSLKSRDVGSRESAFSRHVTRSCDLKFRDEFVTLSGQTKVGKKGRRWPGMPGPGPCKAMFRRYKCVEGRCLEYIYGGCGPDGGGYHSMVQCRQHCNGFRPPFPGRPRNTHERRPVAN